MADNRSAEVSLDWDADVINELAADVDLSFLFTDAELALFNQQGGIDDPEEHWQDMPEFNQQDLTAFRQIQINLGSQKDVDAFALLIGQHITEKTRLLWYPAAVKDSTVDLRMISDES